MRSPGFRRHLARQHIQFFGIGGQRMRLPVVVELQAVFEVPQKLVGGGQARVFAGREQILIVQPRQREQGAAVPHPELAAAMQPLQALHQKLDIANAAGRQLDIESGMRRAWRPVFR